MTVASQLVARVGDEASAALAAFRQATEDERRLATPPMLTLMVRRIAACRRLTWSHRSSSIIRRCGRG
jgi:hypothetical protein